MVAGRRPVLELLRAAPTAERILIARELKPSGILAEIRKLADAAAIPVRMVPRSEVSRVSGEANHQGVVAVTARYRYTPLDRLLKGNEQALLFVDGVTDPHNLGSLLRSADGAGFDGVVIPARRSVGVTDAVRRVSSGASEVVPVARVGNLSPALDQAKQAGLWIVGLDASADVSIWDSGLLDPPVGLVLGAEDRGIGRTTAQRCDEVVGIPSQGRLASLNVAVAGAIAMFEVARRRRFGRAGSLPQPSGDE